MPGRSLYLAPMGYKASQKCGSFSSTDKEKYPCRHQHTLKVHSLEGNQRYSLKGRHSKRRKGSLSLAEERQLNRATWTAWAQWKVLAQDGRACVGPGEGLSHTIRKNRRAGPVLLRKVSSFQDKDQARIGETDTWGTVALKGNIAWMHVCVYTHILIKIVILSFYCMLFCVHFRHMTYRAVRATSG